ncbi:MAG TPA: hypothetical protein PLJ35_09925 [Anaerolineae bacterium]|nr:hypothetical protein [Anaerolineae bacterium]HOQ99123.1 hypothetical protein [Anaerolineae bacterium]HPL27890.1 hypothetical protein [Anaerolineae bacterium]
MARRRGFHLSPPRKVTLIIAAVLWAVGLAFYIPGAAPAVASIAAAIPVLGALPNLGAWLLAAAGALLMIGVTVDGI